MDPQTWLLILGVGGLAWLAFRRAPARRPRDLSDVMTGLFRHSADLGWPTGVQEEDTIRPWGVPGSSDPTSAVLDEMKPEAVIEDDVTPIEVSRIRRAA
jgi:hypothetical protein